MSEGDESIFVDDALNTHIIPGSSDLEHDFTEAAGPKRPMGKDFPPLLDILTILSIMANIGGMKAASKKVSKSIGSAKVNRRELARYGHASYAATEAKHEFGRVLEQAIHGATVIITKHDSPRAVLISIDQFKALQEAPGLKLNTLSDEFDALLDRMQTPSARRGMSAAFDASAKRLGRAAVAFARKRG